MRPRIWTFTRLVLVAAAALTLSSCIKKELETGLSGQDSQEIMVALKEHGIDSVREFSSTGKDKGGSWTVYVRGGNDALVGAWQVLQDNGLPREKVKGLEEAFENSGIIPTAGEEKARMLVGLEGQISRTLKSITGVVDARVQVVLPDNSPLLDKTQWSPTTASVLIRYQGNQPPLRESEIKLLVAKSVEGLLPENVGVVLKRVYPAPEQSRDVWWYLGNQEILGAAVTLLAIAAILLLALALQTRRLRRQVLGLRDQLNRVAQSQQAVAKG
jgi:type III secretion protein J